MQSQRALTEEQESANLLLWSGVLIVGVVLPLVILIVLFVTDLNVKLGAALGGNLHSDANLVIYDANCRTQASWATLSLIYWTADAAPLTLSYDTLESAIINSPAGIQTLEVTIRSGNACPEIVTLTDKSRNRVTDSPVEVRQ